MIKIKFSDFIRHNYQDEFCLYILRNSEDSPLYIGISRGDVWERWFGYGGHITLGRFGPIPTSHVGRKVLDHHPESMNWKIELWSMDDCTGFCGSKVPDDLIFLEAYIIGAYSPVLNISHNPNPQPDNTLESKEEISRKKDLDRVYDEIFNKQGLTS